MPKILTVTVPSNPVDVIQIGIPGQVGPAGPEGPAGPPDIISIGTITTTAPGTQASATISGVTPNRLLNLSIPQGPAGAAGPASSLAIGTINTLAEGQSATATITGTAPNYTLNLAIPRGYGAKPGGAAGDVMTKVTSADYDTAWTAATSVNTAGTIMRRNATGHVEVTSVDLANSPAAASHAARRDYVDSGDRTPPRSFSGNTHVIDAGDENKLIYTLTAGSTTITVPTWATSPLPIGFTLEILRASSDSVTVQPADGTVALISPDNYIGTRVIRSIYGVVRLRKYAMDSWTIDGDIELNLGTDATTGNTIMRRDAAGKTALTGLSLTNAPEGPQWATRKDYVDTQVATRAAAAHTHTATDISNSTATGRSVLTAVDAAAARTAIGAGTSSLAIGTTSTTAKAGDYTPPSDGAAGVATMRTLGTGATQAAAGNDARLSDARTPTAHTHVATTDLTATGTKDATTFLRGDNTWAVPPGSGASSPTYANLPAGTTITVMKSGGVWPARPTSRTDIVVAWKGPDPSPSIITSGTAGMMDNVDYRMVTP